MADLKISELPELDATGVTNNDVTPIVAGGVTHKVKKSSYLKTITDSLANILNVLNAYEVNFGALSNGSTASTLVADVYTPITNYISDDELGVIADEAAGFIQVTRSGRYRVSANIIIEFDEVGNNRDDIFIGLFNNVDGLVYEMKDFIGKNSDAESFYPNFIFTADANKQYWLEIKSEKHLTNVSYPLCEYSMQSVYLG